MANPTLIQVNHGNGAQGDKGNDRRVNSVDDPLPSITTSRGLGLAEPLLDPIQPKPYVIPNFGERMNQGPRIHDVEEPLPAVTSRGAGNLVSPLLDEVIAGEMADAGIDPRRIVLLDGQPYLLDIRFRMLQNSELARAMGFEDEETKYEFIGNISEVTKQIGNAVPVRLAKALVKAALGWALRISSGVSEGIYKSVV